MGAAAGGVVSPQVFGVNAGWEEMGYGIMLDGDYLADRSFRTWNTPGRAVWSTTVPTGGAVSHVPGPGASPPQAAAYDGYLHIQATAEPVVVSQRLIGPLRAGATLHITFSTRATVNTPLMSALVARADPFLPLSNTQYAATVAGAFTHHSLTLTVTQDQVDAVVILAVTGPGEVDLDEVRLMGIPPGSGAPRVDPAVTAWIQAAGIRNVLWPGGFAADHLNWRATVGPAWERAEMDTDLHAPETPAFGVDELFALAEALNLDVVLQLNALGTAQDAAEFVEYLRGDGTTPGGALRAMHGHAAPYEVLFAQLGNEPSLTYGALQDPTGGDNYAQRAQALITAVDAVDPTFLLSGITEAGFQRAPWLAAGAPLLAEWNPRAWTGTHGLRNNVDVAHGHYYAVSGYVAAPADVFPALMAGGAVLRDTLAGLRAYTGALPLWLTEFHVTLQDQNSLVDPARLRDLQAGLGVADLYLTLLREDVAGAQFFDLSQRVGYGALTGAPAWRPRPTGHVVAIMSAAAGEPRLSTTITPPPPTRTVATVGNIPDAQGYALLDSVATQQPNGMPRIFVMNRDAQAGVTVGISAGVAWTTAQVTTFTNALLRADNETAPTVTPVATSLTSGMPLTVPAASLVRVDLQ